MTRILILEDDFETAHGWRDALVDAGYEVTLSYTSSEAVAQIEHQVFDLYIVDLRIEIGIANVKDSGVKLLGYMAKIMPREMLRLRVIGVSGLLIEKDDALVRQSFELFDVVQFMAKPFEPRELVARVEFALRALKSAS